MSSYTTVALLACWTAASCAATDRPLPADSTARSRQEDASAEPTDESNPRPLFPFAALYKPDDGELSDTFSRYAPLIVVQSPALSERQADPAQGHEPISLLTVYVHKGTLAIGGRELAQVTYAWCAPGDEQCVHSRGVRMILGDDGFPLVWETLTNETAGGAILYVSGSFEQAAREHFDQVLPGRRFTAERGRNETPDITVVDVLPDGPVPMGPYVYLTAAPEFAHAVILCRCSPSQVGEFAATADYAMRESEQAPARLRELMQGKSAAAEALRWQGK